MNPNKQKFLQGLGGGSVSPFKPNFGAVSTVDPLTANIRNTTKSNISSNMGATSPAKQQYINNASSSQSSSPIQQPEPRKEYVSGEFQTMPQEPKRDPYRESFETYLKALQPDAEYEKAYKNLSDFEIQSMKDQEKALGMGETLGFATGEASRVNRENQFERMARASTLDALTGRRTAQTEAAKARLDFEKSLIPEEKSISEKYGTGAIGEYNFAKEQGYTGSFADYQNEDANRKRSITNINTGSGLKETGAERTALGYYLRGKDALDTAATIEDEILGKNLAGQLRLQYAPNWLQSQDNQIYRQLQRQFTEARLRKESGAAIPTDEYTKDAQTYFAQPGDTKETLERKKNARAVVLKSLEVGSGNAFKNYYSDGTDSTASLEDPLGIRR